jgi:hypothetical protein
MKPIVPLLYWRLTPTPVNAFLAQAHTSSPADHMRKRQLGMSFSSVLADSSLLLQPSDIGGDLRHLCISHVR